MSEHKEPDAKQPQPDALAAEARALVEKIEAATPGPWVRKQIDPSNPGPHTNWPSQIESADPRLPHLGNIICGPIFRGLRLTDYPDVLASAPEFNANFDAICAARNDGPRVTRGLLAENERLTLENAAIWGCIAESSLEGLGSPVLVVDKIGDAPRVVLPEKVEGLFDGIYTKLRERGYKDRYTEKCGQIDQLTAEVERLRAALGDYGKHAGYCGVFIGWGADRKCDCGLDAALRGKEGK
jgi:hypothetical protein